MNRIYQVYQVSDSTGETLDRIFLAIKAQFSNFSRLLKQEANRKPSGQHTLDKDYYNRIEAVQFTISHDDGKIISDLEDSDVILVGISRTSKTPTSIYLANRGYKVSNIPVILNKNLPNELFESSKKTCVVGLICEPTRLSDVRKNRMQSMHEDRSLNYTNEKKILNELENSKEIFKKYNWPVIDVTRKSVEETAASIIKILDILNSK